MPLTGAGPARAGAADPVAVELLERGRLDVVGRIVEASNATLLASVTLDGTARWCVYKPVAGERPLWDFPRGTLAMREVAAYRVSAATGWDLVPPTLLREGPFGVGSLQLWVGQDPLAGAGLEDDDEREDDEHEDGSGDEDEDGSGPPAALVDLFAPEEVPAGWLAVLAAQDGEGRPVVLAHADDPRLLRMSVFDAVVNNADRKGGHVLRDSGDRVYGVDHGVTFHVEDKLRTVLWGWAGEPLPDEVVDVLTALGARLQSTLGASLSDLLAPPEVAALGTRVAGLLEDRRLPQPGERWPVIPWPPF